MCSDEKLQVDVGVVYDSLVFTGREAYLSAQCLGSASWKRYSLRISRARIVTGGGRVIWEEEKGTPNPRSLAPWVAE